MFLSVGETTPLCYKDTTSNLSDCSEEWWRRGKNRGSEEGGYPLGNGGGIYAEKGRLYGVFQEGAIMGRFGNLLWVVKATHGRSHRRPTVGFFGDLP